MSSSAHIDNKKSHITSRNKTNTRIRTYTNCRKKCIQLILLCQKRVFFLSFHSNEANSYLFVNGTEIYKFKAKDSETVAIPLCLGNISKDWSTDNMKKMDMSMILVLIMMLLMLMILKTSRNI